MNNDFERRTLAEPIELRGEKGSLTAAGYGIVYNKLSSNLGGFVERALPGLADKTIKEQDVRALVDHNPSLLLGRSSAGTLRLGTDATGVWYEVDIPDTTVGRDLAVLLERNDITGSSFGFRTLDDKWGETPESYPRRDLVSISMRDIGPVTFPAYPDATSALRSLAEARSLDLSAVTESAANNDLATLIKRSDEKEQSEEEEEDQAKPILYSRYRKRS